MKKVVVAGSGVLGTQIAFHSAYHNHTVIVYDIKDEFLEKAKAKMLLFFEDYKKDIQATQEQLDNAIRNISYSSDLAVSVKDADILIEAIPENVEIKKEFYIKLSKIAPDKTIFCTNSSTLLPSQFAAETGRPEKFLALHFLNGVWKSLITEVMVHPGTSPEAFAEIVAFSKSIGLTPLQLHKEQPGYITNSLSVPWVASALKLWADGVSDFQTIDKTWMIGMNTKFPPFAFVDSVGLGTAYNIMDALAKQEGNPVLAEGAKRIKEEYIDKGKLGIATGEGFYKYPNPAYLEDSFLK